MDHRNLRNSQGSSHQTNTKIDPHAKDYRCQFCLEWAPIYKWKDMKDHCPNCGEKYDAILAQEEDDENW